MGKQTKFSRAAETFRALRREGPRRFSEKRPRTFVSALLSVAAAAWSKNQHLRDFWLRSIFDFFDSIVKSRPQAAKVRCPLFPQRPTFTKEVHRPSRTRRFQLTGFYPSRSRRNVLN